MCVLAQPRSFRSCQDPFLHLRAQFLPRSHLRLTSGRARTPITFSKSPVTCSGRDSALGTKCLLKQRAAPQRPSAPAGAVPADHAPGGEGPPWQLSALNSSNRHLWSLPGAGFTQPVTHSLIGGSSEQVALSQSEEASPLATLLLGSLWEALVWLQSTSCRPEEQQPECTISWFLRWGAFKGWDTHGWTLLVPAPRGPKQSEEDFGRSWFFKHHYQCLCHFVFY